MSQTPLPATPTVTVGWPIADAGRLASLADLGLTSVADPAMDRFAQRVRDLLDVPISLVSFVQPDQQVFPGMCGLPEPWAGRRSTPLNYSFCQHVVNLGAPLIIDDTAVQPLARGNAAVDELHVRAYAGMPLRDGAGRVLGSLCAIDLQARTWTTRETTILADLAKDCSNEICLRLSRLDADRELRRRDELEIRLTVALDRVRRLLTISESLSEARTEVEIHDRLAEVVDPSNGLIHIRLRGAEPDGSVPGLPAALKPVFDDIVGHRRVILAPDLSDRAEPLDPQARLHFEAEGLSAIACVPVIGSDRVLGVLELGWDVTRTLDPFEQSMVNAIASYVSQTLERAQLIEHRTSVARQLQRSMLTTLPHVAGLVTAACYLPGDSAEEVGGDWYDAIILPRDDRNEAGRQVLAVTVGDIIGHDIPAAAVMGQVSAMLRQAAWDQPEAPPSSQITSLELACTALGVDAHGSAVLGHFVRQSQVGDGWTMTWTNAGHPSPLLAFADGTVVALAPHDLLFGYPDLLPGPRGDASVDLPPGSTVLFYTDGITDRVDSDPAEDITILADLLSGTHSHGPQAVIAAISTTFNDANDDIVALAVHVPATQPPASVR